MIRFERLSLAPGDETPPYPKSHLTLELEAKGD
jgi:hypothetical protein